MREIREGDGVDVLGVKDVGEGVDLVMRVRGKDGGVWETGLAHDFHEGQLPWLWFGGALNYVRSSIT
jgi:hypothetical protein